MRRLLLPLVLVLAVVPARTQSLDLSAVREALSQPILDPNQPLIEVQIYTGSRVPQVPQLPSASAWQSYAEGVRTRVLDEVVLRGEAKAWAQAPLNVEWGEVLPGDGYRIRKLRFEAVPGFWIPALLYEPANLTGKTAAVLNVNGHEGNGTANPYIQARCITLAKRGLLALNPEWIGKGQLNVPDQVHYRMNQLDLTGTSGLSVFYLSLKRSLDILLRHPHADPQRIAVTGLSGGGWQTIFISSLDTRVRLANPVAGYSSFVTRAQWPETDMGDSEQTPSDLAAVADYSHLTAIMAPRPLLLTYNAKDNCCFRADYAVAPLIQAALPIYRLLNAEDRLSWHANHDTGHNYGPDNREALYRFLKQHFGIPEVTAEAPDSGIRERAELDVPLRADNATFTSLALRLAENLPAHAPPGETAEQARQRLRNVLRLPDLKVRAESTDASKKGNVRRWRLHMNGDWIVPAVELTPGGPPIATTIVFHEEGRTAAAEPIADLLKRSHRVIAIDPFYFGESKIAKRDHLFAFQIAALGERPLGIQVAQLLATAKWAQRQSQPAVEIAAFGPRASLIALLAAAVDPTLIRETHLHNAFDSLKEILTRNIPADKAPELFCFGLLAEFDIPQLQALGGR